MNEKDLLNDILKRGILGKGEAKFEVNVGLKTPNYVDLIYETDSEIWIIEAKIDLDYKALGQILFYKELYHHKFMPSKPVKLGVVCLRSSENLKPFYENQGIKVFILEDKERDEESSNPVCGVCGKLMIKNDNDDWICKTCHYFFGISSKPVNCEECGKIYGTYPAVEDKVLWRYGKYFIKTYWKENVCPRCRREHSGYETLANLIKREMEERELTKNDLIFEGIPEEFIEFCLGRKDIYP